MAFKKNGLPQKQVFAEGYPGDAELLKEIFKGFQLDDALQS